jgi:Protein of unknown function (DUF2933)
MPRMCLNWKVLAALGVVGGGLLVVSPQLALRALPFLAFAACPLSMILMMRGMTSRAACNTATTPKQIVGQSTGTFAPVLTQNERIAQLEAEVRRLRAEQVPLRDLRVETESPPMQARVDPKV